MSAGAHYRCCRCEHEWTAAPGPTACPACGHVYLRWLNWERWRRGS